MGTPILLLTVLQTGLLWAQTPALQFVEIQPGEFIMGCTQGAPLNLPDGTPARCDKIAKPAHRVRVTKAFDIGKYEVTQAQWEAVMGSNPSYFKGPDRPVEQVSWAAVQDFLARLDAGNDDYHYRLPTEAEWEYAARAGDAGEFSDSQRLDDIAWFGAGGRSLTDSQGETHPVGQKQPNAWGLYDMRGNVAEWVSDWLSRDWMNDDYYTKSPVADPQGPASGGYHLARGGSWYSTASYLRASNRYPCACTSRRDIGFRVVRVQNPVLL